MKRTVMLFALFLTTSLVMAQDFQGKAIYKTSRKVDIQLDSTQVNSEQHQMMMDMLKKQFQKTYILSFNKEASIYKEDKELEAPQPAGVQVMVINTGGADILYKNIKENRYTNQSESFSKLFLIQDALEEHDWELTNEKKYIGDYECFKATKIREMEVVRGGISINGDKDLDAETEAEPEMKEVTVTAWYTPQIPVNNGPGNYQGLPGLILEVNDGTTTMVCSKLVLNPEKDLNIEEPTKGKKVNQEEYDAIIEKKLNEMQERMKSNWNENGRGENVEIRIGG
ncbi:GLPGLI family protein [Hanstruepera neustonica]|uniref:GLPGLI family protein n=1 Tax=Hanstruepera neustonica TaxID=1445657 RepID=A0A2K1E0X7_9FLAO|nr:GLPGLI family protein [Hanstruepera neustonica]PNQ73929.1 GLPGLI family protein [Hanstruepera neustonica]